MATGLLALSSVVIFYLSAPCTLTCLLSFGGVNQISKCNIWDRVCQILIGMSWGPAVLCQEQPWPPSLLSWGCDGKVAVAFLPALGPVRRGSGHSSGADCHVWWGAHWSVLPFSHPGWGCLTLVHPSRFMLIAGPSPPQSDQFLTDLPDPGQLTPESQPKPGSERHLRGRWVGGVLRDGQLTGLWAAWTPQMSPFPSYPQEDIRWTWWVGSSAQL